MLLENVTMHCIAEKPFANVYRQKSPLQMYIDFHTQTHSEHTQRDHSDKPLRQTTQGDHSDHQREDGREHYREHQTQHINGLHRSNPRGHHVC